MMTAILTRDDVGTALDQVLRCGRVPIEFQPVVDLDGDGIVGYEALARPRVDGRTLPPAPLFSMAERRGVLGDLDRIAARSAVEAARRARFGTDHPLFVNITVGRLDAAIVEELEDASDLTIILEINERDVVARPAELLRLVVLARERGHAIALDDVGIHPESLSLLPVISPDVVKLDRSMLGARPGRLAGRTARTVLSHANRTGASIIAEGIETEGEVDIARSLGGRFGQGWHLGCPAPLDRVPPPAIDAVRFVSTEAVAAVDSPYDLLDRHGLRSATATGDRLLAISLDLEDMAMRSPDAVLLSTFQRASRFTAATANRYGRIARDANLVVAFAEDMPARPVVGVRGQPLDPSDPLRDEWSVVLRSPSSAAALVARQVAGRRDLAGRSYRYAVTSDPALVDAAAHSLLRRVR